MTKVANGCTHWKAVRIIQLLWLYPFLLPLGFTSPAVAQSTLTNIGAQYLDHLVASANLIYAGTVTDVKVSSVPGVPASDRTVLTRIDVALTAPGELAPLEGRTVTLFREAGAPLLTNDQYVFFAQTWLVGDNVAVREIGRLAVGAKDDLGREIQSSQRRLSDNRLVGRLSAVDVVAVGTVTRIEPAARKPTAPVSEHNAQWQRALMEITSVLKGNPPPGPVTLLFPATLDVAWVGTPRPRIDQQAVWLLSYNRDLQGYTALDPLDVQPVDQADRIRGLIRGLK